jgi:hypothetical protein
MRHIGKEPQQIVVLLMMHRDHHGRDRHMQHRAGIPHFVFVDGQIHERILWLYHELVGQLGL